MMDARREEAMRPMPLKGNAEEGDGLMTPGLGLGIQPPRTVRTTVTAISPGRLTTTSNGLQFILQTAGVCGKGCKQEDILSSSGIVSLSVASSRSDCPSCFDATTTVSFPPISRPLVKPNAMFGIVDKIDFQGQGVAELIIHLFLTAGAAIGFLLGLVLQSVSITFYILGASLLLTAIVVVPPWPVYRSHSVKWLPKLKPRTTSLPKSPSETSKSSWLRRLLF